MGLLKSIESGVNKAAASRDDKTSTSLRARVNDRAGASIKGARQSGWGLNAVGPIALGAVAAMGALAYYNVRRTRQDESAHPPMGRFISVDGVRLHYIDKGKGDVVTLIHGNLTLAEDFVLSGVVDKLAERYRVIVFDRPGFGYSDRPHRLWTPSAYAELLQKAFAQLGIDKVTVVTHSFASLIGLDIALQHPSLVKGLVLIAGYFHPTVRADVFVMSFSAIPGVGDILRYTISPLVARVTLPGVIKWLFSPAPVTERFEKGFPKSFAARPVQIGAEAEDSVLMAASAAKLQERYSELKLPIAIVSGDGDKMIDLDRQAKRFHDETPQSTLTVIPGAGHMAHHTAPDQIVAAIDRVVNQEKPSRAQSMWSDRSYPLGV